MPYFHCDTCHHEWEGSKKDTKCDWCGSQGYILEDETPLEKAIKELPQILNNLTKKDK